MVAIRPTAGSRLVLSSLHPDKYPEKSYGTDPNQVRMEKAT